MRVIALGRRTPPFFFIEDAEFGALVICGSGPIELRHSPALLMLASTLIVPLPSKGFLDLTSSLSESRMKTPSADARTGITN